MSKQLILIRHANAKSGHFDLADFDRALDKVGIEEAQEMAFRLRNNQFIPESIISSSAIRAISTARIFAGVWNLEHTSIVEKPALYSSSIPALLRVINGIDDGLNSVALFGHNPEISALANYFIDDGLFSMPTCCTMVINFDVDQWSSISKGLGTMLLFDYPGADSAR